MSNDEGGEHSLGGWLLVLCVFLAIWQPVNLALVASNALAALPVRGWPLALLLAARVVVTACGLAAALAIYHRHAGAMVMAVVSLTLSACVEVFVYATSYFPSNRLPGDHALVHRLVDCHGTAPGWRTSSRPPGSGGRWR